MISKIAFFLILMAVVPDVFIDRRFISHKKGVWRRILWWMPSLAMIAYTLVFVFDRNFAPADVTVVNVYLFLVGLLVVPKCLFAICSAIGWAIRKVCRSKRNYGNLVGVLLVAFC